MPASAPWQLCLSRLLLGLVLGCGSVQAAQPSQVCDAQCQAQQGLAVQRVLQGLLGPGQTVDLFKPPPNTDVYGQLNYTTMRAAGFPAHCLQPGTYPAFKTAASCCFGPASALMCGLTCRLPAAVSCCSPDGSFSEAYPIVPTSSCSPQYAVMGLFVPTLDLGGSLVDDAAVWSTLNTLHLFIAAGTLCLCLSIAAHKPRRHSWHAPHMLCCSMHTWQVSASSTASCGMSCTRLMIALTYP